MALSQADHIQAAKQQLLNKRREAENEIREIDEALAGLDKTMSLITGKPVTGFKSHVEERSPEPEARRTLANRNVTKLVREYVEDYAKDTVFRIPEIIAWLKRQGVTGKDRSLYSAVHVILKDESKPGTSSNELHYTKGVGFYKGRQPESMQVAGELNRSP